MTADRELSVELLEPRAASEIGLVDQLTALINKVYVTAESGLWRDGTTRTTTADVAGLIRGRRDRRRHPARAHRGQRASSRRRR
jgi:hypothetical protein